MSKPHTTRQVIKNILLPSWFEAGVIIIVSLGAAGYLLTTGLIQRKGWGEYVDYTARDIGAQARGFDDMLPAGYHQAIDWINSSSLIGDATIFVLWGIIGLMAYSFVSVLWQKILGEIELFDRLALLRYNKRAQAVEDNFIGIGLRIAGMLGLIGLVVCVRYAVLPLIVSLMYNAFLDNYYLAAGSVLAGLGLMMICMHIGAVLVRLTLLRTRVFFTRYSIAE